MKITHVQATAEASRRAKPIRDALQTLDTVGHCRIEVQTEAGVTGRASIYFGRIEQGPAVLAALSNTLFMESGLLPPGSPIQLVDRGYILPEEPGFGAEP